MVRPGNIFSRESATGEIDARSSRAIRKIGHKVLFWASNNVPTAVFATASAAVLLFALNADSDIAHCPVDYNGPVVSSDGAYLVVDEMDLAGQSVAALDSNGIDNSKVYNLVLSGWDNDNSEKRAGVSSEDFRFGSVAGSLCTNTMGQYMLNPDALKWVQDYESAFPKHGNVLSEVVDNAHDYHFPARS